MDKNMGISISHFLSGHKQLMNIHHRITILESFGAWWHGRANLIGTSYPNYSSRGVRLGLASQR